MAYYNYNIDELFEDHIENQSERALVGDVFLEVPLQKEVAAAPSIENENLCLTVTLSVISQLPCLTVTLSVKSQLPLVVSLIMKDK